MPNCCAQTHGHMTHRHLQSSTHLTLVIYLPVSISLRQDRTSSWRENAKSRSALGHWGNSWSFLAGLTALQVLVETMWQPWIKEHMCYLRHGMHELQRTNALVLSVVSSMPVISHCPGGACVLAFLEFRLTHIYVQLYMCIMH